MRRPRLLLACTLAMLTLAACSMPFSVTVREHEVPANQLRPLDPQATGGPNPALVGDAAEASPSSAAPSTIPTPATTGATPPPSTTLQPTPAPSTEKRSAKAGPSPSTTKQLTRQEKKRKVIYLTFDDGPWVPYTDELLDILAEYDAKATFFVVGEMAAYHSDKLRRIHAEGHAIGNHTWGHADLKKLSDQGVADQLTQTAETVGKNMAPCMRPPYGSADSRVRRISQELGYATVMWTTHAWDWERPPAQRMAEDMRKATQPHLNLLLHDGGGDRTNTVEAVRLMLPYWASLGYTFEVVPECAGRLPENQRQ